MSDTITHYRGLPDFLRSTTRFTTFGQPESAWTVVATTAVSERVPLLADLRHPSHGLA